MHHVVALIAERHEGTCTNWSLSRLLCALGPRLDTKLQSSWGSHRKQPLYSYRVEVRKNVCIQLLQMLSGISKVFRKRGSLVDSSPKSFNRWALQKGKKVRVVQKARGSLEIDSFVKGPSTGQGKGIEQRPFSLINTMGLSTSHACYMFQKCHCQLHWLYNDSIVILDYIHVEHT
ncbi:hypothetical protein HanXRQr2_Chr11g0502701 [Helianthus annuus]|uniref:Uncharacterized protein n=1 Tax=Helianthus annuus TaxID=4232 RepID=A0A9K3N103_HELAN|nr:hypothetical protein HanXRQr2_Chr11g0502701 [Helianthus annuus]